MPLCRCISHGCGKPSGGGTERDTRTFDKHGIDDFRLKGARACAEKLEQADSAIASFVGSMSLGDKASGPSMRSGGRLWSMAPASAFDLGLLEAHIKPHSDAPAHVPLSKQQLLRTVLDRLKRIEEKIGDLNSSTAITLAAIGSPAVRMAPFPLETDLESTRTLESELSKIKTDFHKVHAMKEELSEDLDDVVVRLKAAKQQWREAAGKVAHLPPVPRSANAPLEYISGILLHIYKLRTRLCIYTTFRPPPPTHS